MSNPYLAFVAALSDAQLQARSVLPACDIQVQAKAHALSGSPGLLLFSPHPDDEVITGTLPLRLLRQSGWRVANVAVTLGSNQARRPERLAELQACCQSIGFDLLLSCDGGLEQVNPAARAKDQAQWQKSVACIAGLLAEQKPQALLLPHERDWNVTHIGTHLLLMDALRSLGSDFSCFVIESEFWGAMDSPNLMVECSRGDLADLIQALSLHRGEVARNPYHLRLPAWMIDNVRRGGELVGGQGALAPDFEYATLYRLRHWRSGSLHQVLDKGRQLPASENPAALFE
jgi:N-acetylglucosamine malate deacetylase 1